MNRPKESDYTSQVAYTRALEKYCDELQEQEPVAFANDDWMQITFPMGKVPATGGPLYTHPPKREWVGLTDEEIVQVLGNVREQLDGNVFGAFAKAIEAKLKEKNT
jgi:hypothetical protein